MRRHSAGDTVQGCNVSDATVAVPAGDITRRDADSVLDRFWERRTITPYGGQRVLRPYAASWLTAPRTG